MPKFSLERWVRMFVVLLGMLHISLINLLRTLSYYLMSSLEKGIA